MHICTLNFLEIQEEFLNISLGCKFRFKILAKSYKRKDNVTLGLALRMKTKRVILSNVSCEDFVCYENVIFTPYVSF